MARCLLLRLLAIVALVQPLLVSSTSHVAPEVSNNHGIKPSAAFIPRTEFNIATQSSEEAIIRTKNKFIPTISLKLDDSEVPAVVPPSTVSMQSGEVGVKKFIPSIALRMEEETKSESEKVVADLVKSLVQQQPVKIVTTSAISAKSVKSRVPSAANTLHFNGRFKEQMVVNVDDHEPIALLETPTAEPTYEASFSPTAEPTEISE